MHLTTDTIAEYILALKDAQRKAKRANNPVSDEYLVMVATKAMMGIQQFPVPTMTGKTLTRWTGTGNGGRNFT